MINDKKMIKKNDINLYCLVKKVEYSLVPKERHVLKESNGSTLGLCVVPKESHDSTLIKEVTPKESHDCSYSLT